MHARSLPVPTSEPAPCAEPARGDLAPKPQAGPRHRHRERDFGVGYGNSSGYASARRFTDGHVDPMFQFR
jgi:hypothetical protein